MTYEASLAYIHSFKRFSARPTLQRITALMHLLGDPQERLAVVHLAGTNGKGSTATMLASIGRAAGYKTGLYISPYILDFRERIQIDGEMIPKEALIACLERVRPLAEQVEDLNEFELITAMAYAYFAEQGCTLVVVEVGLGGTYDATNVIRHPLVSVITAIGLDHTGILGNTLAEIAAAKAGIIKPGAPVVTSAGQDPAALAVLLEQACKRGVPLVQPASDPEVTHLGLDGTDLRFEGRKLHLSLPGNYQIENALTAVTAATQLGALPAFHRMLEGDAIARGIAAARFPARLEVLCREPLVLLDGAHNPPGAKALAESLPLVGGRPITAIMGVLADKDSGGVLELLAPHFRRLICVTPQNPRALDAHLLAARADALGLRASAAHSAREAYELAAAVAAAEEGAVLICGSLYLAAELRPIVLEG